MQAGTDANRAMGLFINTLPLRLDLDDTSVEESVRRTHLRLAGLLQHEHASLALAQRCSGIASPAPLFSALLNYRHNHLPEVADARDESAPNPLFDGIEWISVEERTNYPLTMSVEDFGQALGLSALVVESVSSTRVCDFMQRALEQLAQALELTPRLPVRQLEVMPEEERHLLLHSWNRTEASYPKDLCIHHLFEEQALKSPDAIALVQGDVQLTYAELNARANRLAHRLIELGVRPDCRVAICADRQLHLVVGLLAILKAGGAYVPLDPAYPGQRLSEILDDAQPVLLLTDTKGRNALNGAASATLPALPLDELSRDTSDANPDARRFGLTCAHLAYVIYTSGSTGKPKGVMIEHRNTVNLLQWARESFSEQETARTLFATSINFDLSVYECFVPLSRGGALHLVEDALSLVRDSQDVSIINTVPSAATALLNAKALPASIRTVNLAGEPLKASLIQAIFDGTQAQRLCNLYGPSETTTYSTWIELQRGGPIIESIGRPIANTRIYLLDSHGRPVPMGTVGELYIGGNGVARGYLNRPELTAERFLQDPFCHEAGARMYRTGDLARYQTDGSIEFLGRADHQVKIRGFRIELGEIETKLAGHPAVRDAVVVAREDTPDGKRLAAYVTARPDAIITVADLREHLLRQLPEFMMPSAFVILERLPLTPNGKLDRKALPAPDAHAVVLKTYEPPQGEIEQTLAAIWSQLLGIDTIGRHDNFFELGGHSLLAVQLIERLRQAGLKGEVPALFANPTLSALARASRKLEKFRI
jgi:amino acid adenylation domain-containing protein